jgi:hypothetical protein
MAQGNIFQKMLPCVVFTFPGPARYHRSLDGYLGVVIQVQISI